MQTHQNCPPPSNAQQQTDGKEVPLRTTTSPSGLRLRKPPVGGWPQFGPDRDRDAELAKYGNER